jgi:hypothetical protein
LTSLCEVAVLASIKDLGRDEDLLAVSEKHRIRVVGLAIETYVVRMDADVFDFKRMEHGAQVKVD